MINSPTRLQILIVHDDTRKRGQYRDHLSRCPDREYTFFEADCGKKGLQLYRLHSPDCILLQDGLADLSTTDFLADLAYDIDAPMQAVVVLAHQAEEAAAIMATAHGAQDYLIEGQLQADAVYRAVNNAVHKARLHREIHDLTNQIEAKNRRLHHLHVTARRLVEDVSQEFRAPLTAIKQFASMVHHGLPDTATEEHIQAAGQANERVDDLRNMVEDMLNISRLETGAIGVLRKDCNIADIIEHHHTNLQRSASAHGAILSISIEPDLPTVFCDPNHVGQAVVILSAAILKSCGHGDEVSVWARHDDLEAQVVVGVTTTGSTLSTDIVRSIRRQFNQVSMGRAEKIEGFGLGLNVVKELVHLNFGQLEVNSDAGAGTTLSFTIPTADPPMLMQRYLAHVRRFREDSIYISLLSGHVDRSVNPVLLDDVGWFLQNRMRRSDLVFRTLPHSWLMVAPTNQHDLSPLMSRLARAWEHANNKRPSGALPPIVLEVMGTWELASGTAELLERFDEELRPTNPAVPASR